MFALPGAPATGPPTHTHTPPRPPPPSAAGPGPPTSRQAAQHRGGCRRSSSGRWPAPACAPRRPGICLATRARQALLLVRLVSSNTCVRVPGWAGCPPHAPKDRRETLHQRGHWRRRLACVADRAARPPASLYIVHRIRRCQREAGVVAVVKVHVVCKVEKGGYRLGGNFL